MPYCKPCDIHYASSHETCVLCHQHLEQTDKGKIFFPVFKKKLTVKPFIKWFILLNVLSMFATVFVDMQDAIFNFSLIVSIVNMYAIALILFVFMPDFLTLKISKIIMLSLIGLLILTIVIGDFRWLLEYVMPIVLSLNTIFYVSMAFFNRERSTDQVYHSSFMSLLGLIPGIMIFTRLVEVIIPSQISVIISLFSFGYVLFFHPKLLLDGIKRRFHI